MAVNLTARVWGPYKELFQIVDGAIRRKDADKIQDLEPSLRRFKPDIVSLLQNPVKNAAHREIVNKANKDGIQILGQQGKEILSKQFIEEALIISDLFDLNEYAAVELLMAGESQQAEFPGLTRGLVAVVLYYDGRNSIVSALRLLLQACKGKTWKLDVSDEVADVVSRFIDQVMNEDFFSRLLDLIRDQNVTTEIEKLISERAIGNQKHRKQVTDLLKEIRKSLADCIFCLSCQIGLRRTETLKLISELRNHSQLDADGTLDPVTQTLLMALLYAVDVRPLSQEDSQDMAKELYIISDETFVNSVHKEVISLQKWECPGLKASLQMAWALTLRTLAQYPENQSYIESCEEDEMIIDMAIEENIFQFLQEKVVSTPSFHHEEFHLREIHNIITDFLVHFPLKVKELRNRGEEASRIILAHMQEGVKPPANLRRDFEQLLDLMAELYSKDPLGLELAVEFWCPSENVVNPTFSAYSHVHQTYRPPQRQISLYKFVRLAGDLLPPSMYIPYLKMLAGLANGPQSAYQCFNLLKTNGTLGGGHASTVSWDHIFMSFNQYYMNLRQETAVISDMAHVYRQYPRGITPQEAEGLAAALQLTRVIAIHDQQARIAICENPNWMTVVTFLGLISCSIPATLKAELLLTVAAFCKSSEIASTVWNSLESSQIIPTIRSTSSHKAGGILVELDEVEARNEEFPLTRAFVELLDVLTDIPVPSGLGAGYRAPGFDPYLDFLRDSVFLKFNTRAYQDPGEKWHVAYVVLKIFAKLQRQYDAAIEDFIECTVEIQGGGTTTVNKPPGHVLMIHMMNDSETLKMVVYIIDEACRLFGTYKDFPGKKYLEKAVLCCLHMLECTLEKQETFLSLLRDSGTSLIVSSLDKLLLAVNPWSGKADHLVKIAQFVVFNDTCPDHALSAVRILCYVCQSSFVQPALISMFLAQHELSKSLLHGFVECLEAEDAENMLNLEEELEEEDINQATIRSATRLSIMKLILYTVDQPSPNMAHFLLGYDLNKVVKTNLQDPGVLGSPRTCLHAVLAILDRGTTSSSMPSSITDTPQLAEHAYHLIYKLCANLDTSAATRRYLRNNHDLLFRHVQFLPFSTDHKDKSGQMENLLLSQQQWLMKAAAIELRLTASNNQRSHTQRLVNLLLQDMVKPPGLKSEVPLESDLSYFDIDSIGRGESHILRAPQPSGGQNRRKILSILDCLSFKHKYSTPIQLELLDPAGIEQEIKKCQFKNEQGLLQCNIKMLHRVLMNELNKLQGSSAAGQRPHFLQEIETLLTYMVTNNGTKQAVYTKKHMFEAWRQMVEVILVACPEDLVQGETRQNIIFEILQDLLIKVSDEEALPELTAPVARVILTLLANQRKCFLTDEQIDSVGYPSVSQYVTLLDAHGSLDQNIMFGKLGGSRTLFASSLQVVLKGLVEHIMRSSSGQQRVRAHLYAALLFYLEIARKPKGLITLDGSHLIPRENEYENLTKENFSTINNYGGHFMEIVSRDACDGHDVGKMLALSTLETVLCSDRSQQWLSFLTSKGYLQHMVDSLVQDCQQLNNMYSPQCEPLCILFIYQSKMSLLTRVAGTIAGAQSMLRCGVMQQLSQCSVLDMRPDVDHQGGRDYMVNYRMLLFPALKLCLAVLTSLGAENQEALSKVQQFVVSHMDVFNAILRDKMPALNVPALEELTLTTAVLSKAVAEDVDGTFGLPETAVIEAKGQINRVRRLMMALLPRYCMSDKLLQQMKSMNIEGQPHDIIQLYVESIAANVISFSRAYVSKSGPSLQSCHLLFTPSLMEAIARDAYGKDDLAGTMTGPSQKPGLGLVILMLKQCTKHFLEVFELHKQYSSKLTTVADLTLEEVKEFCPTDNIEKMSSQQRHTLAKRKLVTVVSCKVEELQRLSYSIENCLFLIWKHLEFYLLHCVPVDQGSSLYQLNTSKQLMRRMQDTPGSPLIIPETSVIASENVDINVTRQDLEKLKADAPGCLNDMMFKNLNNIEQCYSKNRTSHSFLQALIRRIRGLLHLHTTRT